jgi:prepilin-type N-terminal cleavage/methylation domain-containing protein
MTAQAPVAPKTAGFTLVEVLISMTILSIASLAMGATMFRAAHQAALTSSTAYQSAAMAGAMAHLDVLPFDLLAAGTTCVTVADLEFPHTKCTTILNESAKVKLVTVVITPTGNALLQPVTSSFRRTISGNATNPLKTQ